MASREGRKQWAGELPVEVVDAVKEEAQKSDKAMWQVVTESTRMFLGLDEVSTEASVKRHIERLESEVDDLLEEKERIESELETRQDRLEGYERKLESIQDQKESYETRLDDILDDLEANKNWKVIARQETIEQLATDKYGQPTTENRQEVKDDLWERAMDQQRDVIPNQFNDSTTPTNTQVAATDGSGSGDSDFENKYDFSKANYDDGDNEEDDDEPVLMTDGGVDRSRGVVSHDLSEGDTFEHRNMLITCTVEQVDESGHVIATDNWGDQHPFSRELINRGLSEGFIQRTDSKEEVDNVE